MDNALIIDLVLAAVLALFALLGARKGLIRSLICLMCLLLSLWTDFEMRYTSFGDSLPSSFR